ncbi:MAG: hypothetical protein CL947_00895 [Epsilonproteobacteria bacterium]|nr:hypothetical protein [Campylobacterota bacterium]|tara:strand:+ start:1924 stop:2301 length:378 start_codon:yes stop_codon:yes gene_type:complete
MKWICFFIACSITSYIVTSQEPLLQDHHQNQYCEQKQSCWQAFKTILCCCCCFDRNQEIEETFEYEISGSYMPYFINEDIAVTYQQKRLYVTAENVVIYKRPTAKQFNALYMIHISPDGWELRNK